MQGLAQLRTPLRRLDLSEDEEALLRGFRFLTGKPLIAVVNLDEDEIRDEAGALAAFAGWASGPGTATVGLSARLESEIRQLPDQDAAGFRSDFGIETTALDRLIATAYRMMGLIRSSPSAATRSRPGP